MALLPIALVAALLVYLGQRLMRSGMRSDGAELWLGLAFVPTGIAIVARFGVAMGIDFRVDPALVNLIAQAVLHFAIACFAAFVWRTFRPADNWARHLFLGIAVVYAINVVLFQLTGAAANQSHPFHLFLSGCLSLVYGWGFVEAVLFHRAMRRRVTLGLADPIVSNRFALFAVWTGGMTLLPVVVSVVRAISLIDAGHGLTTVSEGGGVMVREDAQWALQVIRMAVVLIGIPMLSAIWLAFFPPARYARWLGARATA